MAADLEIHVLVAPCTEEHLARFFSSHLGSKYFNWNRRSAKEKELESEAYEVVANTPSVWVGEVSWLKAALTDDPDTFIPGPVVVIQDIIGEDLPIIDDALINQICAAFKQENTTGYDVSEGNGVRDFLEKYRGERVFTVSW